MTLLPLDDWNVKGYRDGPDYTPAQKCAMPRCEEVYRLEAHHCWRRSFLVGAYQWVQLSDGTILPNVVLLCHEHHKQITEGVARIEWWADEATFFWMDPHEKLDECNCRTWDLVGPLDPQPPRLLSPGGATEPPVETPARAEEEPEPGKPCPSCKRRYPYPKKKTSPTTKTISYRVPLDDADTHKEILEAAYKHLGGDTSEKFWQWAAVTKLAAYALQGPGE